MFHTSKTFMKRMIAPSFCNHFIQTDCENQEQSCTIQRIGAALF